MTAEKEVIEKIHKYFKRNNLPKPITINKIGKWACGDCYAVTCGLLFIKKYCVYFVGEDIASVRKR